MKLGDLFIKTFYDTFETDKFGKNCEYTLESLIL